MEKVYQINEYERNQFLEAIKENRISKEELLKDIKLIEKGRHIMIGILWGLLIGIVLTILALSLLRIT